MRLSFKQTGLSLALCLALMASRTCAQNPNTLDPDQSAAKSNQLLKLAIDAMGGPIYRSSQESDCEGRVANFDRSGNMSGYSFIRSYWRFPDKNRTEYIVKSTKGGIFAVLVGNLPIKGGMLIQVFSGDKGWTMDKAGVSEADVTVISEFQQAMKRQMHNVLLNGGKGDGVYLRYGGLGIVDLKPVDWVEISDQEDHKVKIALDHMSHLPLRTVALTPDEEMHQVDEDITIYSNYQEKNGIQTPMQVSRERNGRRLYQLFYESCNNNNTLPADFFTKEGLEKRFKETGGKVKEDK